ncbi:hypothetical protein PG999_004517 [Apiospora kogelbergensis]|uniref:Uncharacterized protein n=1 Tax=Apiospora kogelbergensis TaxID=1337665 RepID=A0AAW0QZI9_9PEZI
MVTEDFNPGEGPFLKSPPMKALKPKLQLSLSPPLLALRRHLPSNHDDAVLILHMDGGKRPDIAIEAGRWPLASSVGEEEEQGSCSPSSIEYSDAAIDSPVMPLTIDLKSLAANALSVVQAPALDALRNVEGPTQKRVSSGNGGRSMGLHQQQHSPGPLPHRGDHVAGAQPGTGSSDIFLHLLSSPRYILPTTVIKSSAMASDRCEMSNHAVTYY